MTDEAKVYPGQVEEDNEEKNKKNQVGISYSLWLQLVDLFHQSLKPKALKKTGYYFISFNNSIGNGLLYFTLIMMLPIHLPFLLIFIISVLAIALVTHKFYFDDIEKGNQELFELKFKDLNEKQKTAMKVISPFIVSAAMGTAVFSYFYIIAALHLFFLFLGVVCPPALFIAIALFFTLFIFMTIIYAMTRQAIKLTQTQWFLDKINMIKSLWRVDNNLTLSQKIWAYTKAILITLFFATGIGLAIYAIIHSYAANWIKALITAGHFLSKHCVHYSAKIADIAVNIYVYALALPIKFIFNADYISMLFYSFSYRVLNIDKFKENIVNIKKSVVENVSYQWQMWQKQPVEQLKKMIIGCMALLWKGIKLFCALINVVAKVMLAKDHPVAMVATGGYEGAKGVKMTTGVSLNEVKLTTFFDSKPEKNQSNFSPALNVS